LDKTDWDTRYATADLLWGSGANQFLVEGARGLQPGRALDLACGEGRNSIWLAAKGWDVVGVDFSQVAIDRARRLASDQGVRVSFVESDLFDYSPPAAGFDLIVSAYLQLPQPELDWVLRTCAAALAPGGTLIVVGHDLANLTDGFGGPQVAEILLSPERVVVGLDGLLRIERADRVTRTVNTTEGERKALDTLVRARKEAIGSAEVAFLATGSVRCSNANSAS
jgi:SAM-dependent methyltransferase